MVYLRKSGVNTRFCTRKLQFSLLIIENNWTILKTETV